ncbi:hypothetical protein LMG23994_01318 [Cupriavidus pinatubonensis]|uniref:Uncharacterized protein n=1 Tax=Cupriavidus pinatubonensis TaxID=248026 RepID=A0ABM8WL90_9BURK|nr:hypothetical protein LMG23994_01318 [Cupriavidus pinatubonensis]
MEVKGITYEEHPNYPGVRTFRCEPLRANLMAEACATNVRQRRHIQCSKCKIGELHAGRCTPPAERVGSKGISYLGIAPERCVRCGTAAYRLICKRTLCASCFNRQRELRIGANAKGMRPKKAAEQLHRAVCLVDLHGDARLLELEYCSGECEAKQVIKRWWPGGRLADYEVQPAKIGAPPRPAKPAIPPQALVANR